MTKPSLTLGIGFLTDCTATTENGIAWVETESSLPTTLTALYGDVFDLSAAPDDAGDEYAYYEYDLFTNLNSNVYSNWLIRYKTSAATGVGAKCELVFTAGTQVLDIGAGSNPAFSETWTTATGTITAGKVVDKVRFYADDYPDSTMAGSYHVYYDFLLLYSDSFTFPFVEGSEKLELVPNKAFIQIPGRRGNIHQDLGIDSPTYQLSGKMDTNSDWKIGTIYGGDLLKMFHEADSDPWQWLASDLGNMKITGTRLVLAKDPEAMAQRTFAVEFRKVDQSCGTNWGWNEWLGQ